LEFKSDHPRFAGHSAWLKTTPDAPKHIHSVEPRFGACSLGFNKFQQSKSKDNDNQSATTTTK
jgi:hypothetical protein